MRLTFHLSALAIPFFATGVLAQDGACESDADCGVDQICALSDCERPCDDGDVDCEPVDCGGGGVCIDVGEPEPECATDADCAEGETCIVETFESCTGVGCVCAEDDPSCACDVPEEECKSETYAFCAPPWAGGCDVDADCGDGFTCELLESCACSGGGGDSGNDNGPEGDAPPDEACVCEPATEGSCVLVRVECDSDADCLEGFECQDEGSAGACSVSEDGDVDCDAPAESASICMPPSFGGGTGAENGLVRADDADEEEEEEGLGDDVDAQNIFNISCAASSPVGALPLVSLALLLRRRRR